MSNYSAVKQSVDEGLQASRPDCSFKSEQSPTVNSEEAKSQDLPEAVVLLGNQKYIHAERVIDLVYALQEAGEAIIALESTQKDSGLGLVGKALVAPMARSRILKSLENFEALL